MRKAPRTNALRLIALALAAALVLPNPAFALRQTERIEAKGGLEELEQALQRISFKVGIPVSGGGLEELGRAEIGPEQRVLYFGGGKIGRGRGGPILAGQNGFDVIFVDPVPAVIEGINASHSYDVFPQGEGEPVHVTNVWGIVSDQTEKILAQATRADWIFTSVIPKNLPGLVPIFQQIIRLRMKADRTAPLNIVFAENLPVDQPEVEQVRSGILQDQDAAFVEFVGQHVGFVGAIVRGGAPESSERPPKPVDVLVKPGPAAFYLDREAIRGPPPSFQDGLQLVTNIRAHREKKALIHNSPQLILGLLAGLKGLADSREAMKDPEILAVATLAAQEAAHGIAARYPTLFTREELAGYIDEFLQEYADPEFKTSVQMLVRNLPGKLELNERLFASARNSMDAGVTPNAITLGIAAARRYLADHAGEFDLSPDDLRQLDRNIVTRARRMGLALPRNTPQAFMAVWHDLIGDLGKQQRTVPTPLREEPLASYDAMLDAEVQSVLAGRAAKTSSPYKVGVSGPTATGKTRFMTALESRLREGGLHVIHLTEDELGVIDRATRTAWETEKDPRWNDWENWIRWDKIQEDLRKIDAAAALAEQTGQLQTVTLEGLYNRAKDGTIDGTRPVEIQAKTVIVYDGIPLAKRYPPGTFDRTILFDVIQRETMRRSLLRDVVYGRDVQTIIRFQRELYGPHWSSYVERFHPEQQADAVYDLTDFRRPLRLVYTAGLEEWGAVPKVELGADRKELEGRAELSARGGRDDGAWLDTNPNQPQSRWTPPGSVERFPNPKNSSQSPSGNSHRLNQNITTSPTPATTLATQEMGLTNNPVRNVAGSNSLKMSIMDRATNSRFLPERNSSRTGGIISQNYTGINKFPAAGLEEVDQQAFQRLVESAPVAAAMGTQGYAVLDAQQAAGLGAEAIGGFLIADSANVLISGRFVIAEQGLDNAAARQLFGKAWISVGSGLDQVIRDAWAPGGAKNGDLVLVKPAEGVSTERVTQLLGEVGYTETTSPRVAIGDEDQVSALPAAAFQLLARQEGLPPAVFLSVAVKLRDEAGNTYTLILMA